MNKKHLLSDRNFDSIASVIETLARMSCASECREASVNARNSTYANHEFVQRAPRDLESAMRSLIKQVCNEKISFVTD